ncbi:MAG TPA: nucleotide disphospho-sugar-binding domain-containing protein [Micromonosporaceae bacterium]|nr:nucleotide disphospho-sugar-binding domain-containing protein [Micromonosporaceae bacterium]
MRVLITTAPGYGHVFAPVPLGWAFRAAGHEVVLATAGRPEADVGVAAWSGLPVVEVAAPARMDAVRAELRASRQRQAEQAKMSMVDLLAAMREQARGAARVTEGHPFAFAAEIYGPYSAAMADGLLAFAERWRPDLLVYESMQGAGPLVAGRLGIPAVEFVPGLCRGPELAVALRAYLADRYADYRVSGPTETATVEVAPPSVAVNQPYGLASRFVPFNGPAVLADWLQHRPKRARVAVTFGSVVPHRLGLAPLRRALADVGRIDAEFVVAVGAVDSGDVDGLPGNVRLHPGYLPLSALLPTCDAVIHHGGPASTLAALAAGLPQLVLPEMADQFVNAEAVRRRGCALAIEDGPVPATVLARLLSDRGLATAAAAVRDEIAALPSPHELVPKLAALAG